ncbi:DUF6308 family protein [Streptomyces sp. NPDC020096]
MGRLPHSDFTERLRVLLSKPQAIADLKRYFAIDLPQGSALPFTGARFEHLDGGGDTSDTANTITASDLTAVQMLSVRVPRPATLALLEGDLGRQLTPLLAKIPTNTDMAKVDIDDRGLDGSVAEPAGDLVHRNPAGEGGRGEEVGQAVRGALRATARCDDSGRGLCLRRSTS